MGIYKLNSFIKRKCKLCISKHNFQFLNGKRIAIDVSQFMYQFKKTNKLMISTFLMCKILRTHNIHAIFVFDGIPPPSKMNTIHERMTMKTQMSTNYYALLKRIKNGEIEMTTKVKKELEYYQNNALRITKNDVNNVKTLLELYGMTYVNSVCEADTVLAYLDKYNLVDAVVSNDSDMFAYGCKYVISDVSILNETFWLYNTNKLYDILHVTERQFKYLCSISKNDFLRSSETFEENYSCKKHVDMDKVRPGCDDDVKNEINSCHMFDLTICDSIPDKIQNKYFDQIQLTTFLSKHNIFSVSS